MDQELGLHIVVHHSASQVKSWLPSCLLQEIVKLSLVLVDFQVHVAIEDFFAAAFFAGHLVH